MSKKIAAMRNLGPATAKMLAEVDIFNEDDLREVGAVDAWHRMNFRFGKAVSLNALYAMEGALWDCDWRRLDAETKTRLQQVAKKS